MEYPLAKSLISLLSEGGREKEFFTMSRSNPLVRKPIRMVTTGLHEVAPSHQDFHYEPRPTPKQPRCRVGLSRRRVA